MSPLPRTDFLFPEEQAQIADDMVAFFADPQFAGPITYRDYQSQTFTPSVGTVVATYTDYSLNARFNQMPDRQVVASQGLYQAGDLIFMIARSLLPVIPDKEDRIVTLSDGVTYGLVRWDSDPVFALWRIVARKVA